MTFAEPIPDLLDHEDSWSRPLRGSGANDSQQLPPPPPGAVPSPGPAPWLFGVGLPSRNVQSVVGREVVDAFELIWPTGEIDEQFLGGPLSEMPTPEPVSDDVVLAIQRAIAAIGSEPEVVDEPPPAPRLPDRSDASAGGWSGNPTPVAPDADGIAMPPDPSDDRRSALKRLISGLRRR